MQMKLALISAYLALAQAVPLAESNADAGLTLVSKTVTSGSDAPDSEQSGHSLERRGVDRHSCYNNGAWMKTSELDKGIEIWCSSRSRARSHTVHG